MVDLDNEADPEQRRLKPTQVMASVLASAFGVQSSRNRKRDFTNGKATHFIVGGLLFTVLFVLTLASIVRLVLGVQG